MSNRIMKKARRVEKTELDREFDSKLGELKRVRDEKNKIANAERRKAVEEAHQICSAAKLAATEEYDAARDKLLKELAATNVARLGALARSTSE